MALEPHYYKNLIEAGCDEAGRGCLAGDVVHILYQGRIVKTAGPELAKEIEVRGYDWIKAEADGQ